MKHDKTVLFETMPVGKALLTMAVPTIISQLITMVYNIADTFFIGMSNDPYKVAAASIVGVLFFMLNSLSNLFGVGGGSMLSRLLGEKREADAKRVGVFSIYGSLCFSEIHPAGKIHDFWNPVHRFALCTDGAAGQYHLHH